MTYKDKKFKNENIVLTHLQNIYGNKNSIYHFSSSKKELKKKSFKKYVKIENKKVEELCAKFIKDKLKVVIPINDYIIIDKSTIFILYSRREDSKIGGDINKKGPKIGGDINIKGPKIGLPKLNKDINIPKIGVGLDINPPKIGDGIDIKCPKIGQPKLDKDINTPKIGADLDINPPKIGDGIDIKGPKIGQPKLDKDINTPKIGAGLDINLSKIEDGIDIRRPKIYLRDSLHKETLYLKIYENNYINKIFDFEIKTFQDNYNSVYGREKYWSFKLKSLIELDNHDIILLFSETHEQILEPETNCVKEYLLFGNEEPRKTQKYINDF